MMKAKIYAGISAICFAIASCSVPKSVQQTENKTVPVSFTNGNDTTQTNLVKWKEFFTDPNLVTLIDSALAHNQELSITMQEIEIAKNEIRLKQAPLSPTVGARIGTGVEKVGRYTSQGAGDASTDIAPGKAVPDPLTDITASLYANWEVDIWKKLRTAKQAAVTRYLSTVEGKNFMVTNLVAEIANSYYELLALDNQLEIVQQNISLQKNALEIVKIQKEASRVTELAVQKFQAEVLKSQSLEFDILQQIKESENNINFLLGRFPQPVAREKNNFASLIPATISAGIPSQLLANRADIRQAELDLTAARLDVKVARAEFYPSLGISAAIGLQAFKPSYLYKLPESLLYSVAGDLAGPLINRNAIKAEFYSANARQLQSMYNYEKSILNAFMEVSTQLSRIDNLDKSYALKAKQVDALNRSIEISNDLFRNARADYLEVLMTQRDALDSKLELVETKKQQLNAVVNVYRSLGGGWE
ncbi:TolC family protein [Ferruginibacter sp. HRS2-29]|uniref:TolC family protein n=1 Tax=Ferruginibacter sp. HRS2-29 TaxID=2487334 RepID=UPI0020CC8749|nr:TolC family protein [Ferruginibacter sp. HRS2-29]MCP9752623.1 TolC family protein [Ferruginibacter sp. HRS2-29]